MGMSLTFAAITIFCAAKLHESSAISKRVPKNKHILVKNMDKLLQVSNKQYIFAAMMQSENNRTMNKRPVFIVNKCDSDLRMRGCGTMFAERERWAGVYTLCNMHARA
jgi:hypothetical protein